MHNMPAVMTLKEFQKATTVGLLPRGRTHLVPIDNWLAYLEANAGKVVHSQMTAMYGLVEETLKWRAARADKDSKSAGVRMGAVTTLGVQAYARLFYLKQIARQGQAYEDKKANGPVAGVQTKGLGDGYATERAAYLKAGKAGPVPSGSAVHSLLSNAQAYGVAANKPFAQLTVQEFTQFASRAGRELIPNEVVFLSKIERLHYLVEIDGRTGLMSRRTPAGGVALVDTDHSAVLGALGYIYAIDRYGNLFAGGGTEFNALMNTNKERANHSSFLSGRDVLCAGNVVVKAGRLKFIDNRSGHYQPTRANLLAALTVLSDGGVNLAHVTVECIEQDAGRKDRVVRTWGNGLMFAMSNGTVKPSVEAVADE